MLNLDESGLFDDSEEDESAFSSADDHTEDFSRDEEKEQEITLDFEEFGLTVNIKKTERSNDSIFSFSHMQI